MAVKSKTVSVGTTAVALNAKLLSSDQPGYSVACMSSSPFFVGGSDVSTTNGWPVAAGEKFSIDLGYNETLYAVSATPSNSVNVLVIGTK